MAGKTKAIPEGFHTLTPSLVVNDAAGAEEIEKGAREFFAQNPGCN